MASFPDFTCVSGKCRMNARLAGMVSHCLIGRYGELELCLPYGRKRQITHWTAKLHSGRALPAKAECAMRRVLTTGKR